MKTWIGPALAAPATLWLVLAFAVPFLIVADLSLQPGSDPFARLALSGSFEQFLAIFADDFYISVLFKTAVLALAVCAATVVLGYPLALWLVSLSARWRPLAISAILVPLLINVVVRSLGIELLLAPDGLINGVLMSVGFPRATNLLYNYGAIGLGLTQVLLPFMVLALYDVLQSRPGILSEAASGLGASRAARFFAVDLPLSYPGLRAGLIFVFLMASTTYVSARMLGGKKAFATGMLVWQEVLENLDAQFASALAIVMTMIGLAVTLLIAFGMGRMTPWLTLRPARAIALPRAVTEGLDVMAPVVVPALVAVALALLLLPLGLVLIQSFNDVPQATMAGFRGFTWRWYGMLLSSGLYFDSFWTSVRLAAATALTAIILATPAAFALVRTRFAGKVALEVFWMFPLSLPQVAIGIGMLRLLQMTASLPAFLGLLAVHVMIALPFCIGLLRASVLQLNRSLEEAAMSLGADPLRCFWLIVLPRLTPGLVASAIVAFLLSFEEVTITSFLTTARMTTLPVRIYAEASYSLEPTVYAISTIVIALTSAGIFLLGRVVRLDGVFAR